MFLKGSIAFHKRMGFSIELGKKEIDGVSVVENYDGRGGDRIVFFKMLEPERKAAGYNSPQERNHP